MIILLSTGLNDWKIKYLVSCILYVIYLRHRIGCLDSHVPIICLSLYINDHEKINHISLCLFALNTIHLFYK